MKKSLPTANLDRFQLVCLLYKQYNEKQPPKYIATNNNIFSML